MLFSGLRVSEVIALVIGDISMTARAGEVTIRHGKGNKQGSVELSSDTREWLKAWLAIRGETDQKDMLFVGERGQPITTTRAIEKRVQGQRERCGVQKMTPHSLRHTCIKNVVDSGHPLSEAQAIARHSRLETTMRYARPGKEDLASAVEDGQLGRMNRETKLRGGK
jgi:site-specific recombinase XerC